LPLKSNLKLDSWQLLARAVAKRTNSSLFLLDMYPGASNTMGGSSAVALLLLLLVPPVLEATAGTNPAGCAAAVGGSTSVPTNFSPL
jgi:hypothetical protein